MGKGFGESKDVGRGTDHSPVTSARSRQETLVVHTRVVLTDRSGDKWLEYILETELIGLAGGLELEEREEPGKAPRFLVEPWVDAACHLLSEETGEEQVGEAQDFPKLSSSSESPWRCQSVGSSLQLGHRQEGSMTPTASQWVSPCGKVSLKMKSTERLRTI